MLQKLTAVISPECCVKCNEEGSALCAECAQSQLFSKKPACFYCNALTPDGRTCKRCRAKTSLNGVMVAYRLQDPVDELIYQLKYFGDRGVANYFAPKLAELAAERTFDVLSFVPTDGKSQRRRGYNQSHKLAKEIGRLSGQPITKLMIRTTHTGQVGLGRQARFASVADNFLVIRKDMVGKHVVVIDDVVTTGATLNECARVLKLAGAKTVWGLAIAKK